jgi:hypothetical protein
LNYPFKAYWLRDAPAGLTFNNCTICPHCIYHHHHHHHKHPGLGHLARSVSRVTVALSIVSSVSQFISFLVGCSAMILKGFGFVAFFAGVKASSFCIHLACVLCSLSVVLGEWSRLFCGHKERNLPEVSKLHFCRLNSSFL